jgi:putative ABC transport system permease protein
MRMKFHQFAYNNVRRNIRTYSAYLLSSTFAVMIFFVYAMFIYHPQLADGSVSRMVKIGMQAAEYVIFGFSFLFLLYSVGGFLKARKKEFGLLAMLGMTRMQLNQLVFLENMLIGLLSVGMGVMLGLLVVKAFFIFAAYALEMPELPFYWPADALKLTILSFLCMFVVISLMTLFFVRNQRVIALLQGANKQKPEPKASIFLALVVFACLAGAYGIALTKFSSDTMLLILGLAIVGTYFLFTQLSVFVIRWLKRRRSFYQRGTNLLWLSDLAYRMKDNARMLFLVTIVSAVAFTATGTFLYFKQQGRMMLEVNPYPFIYVSSPDNPKANADLARIDRVLAQEQVQAEKITFPVRYFMPTQGDKRVAIIRQSDYNRLARLLDRDPIHVRGQAGWLLRSTDEKNDLGEMKRITFKENGNVFHIDRSTVGTILPYSPGELVVADTTFTKLAKPTKQEVFTFYIVDEWMGQEPKAGSVEHRVSEKLVSMFPFSVEAKGELLERATVYLTFKQFTSVSMFIGMFIVFIFFMAAGSFLYFRLYADLDQDSKRYQAISKLGLTERELARANTVQMALLFFVPFIVAVVHSIVALMALQEDLQTPVIGPATVGIGSFFLLQFVYFLIVRSSYLKSLKRVLS